METEQISHAPSGLDKETKAERDAQRQGDLDSHIKQKIKDITERMGGVEREHSPMAQKLRQLAEHFNGGKGRDGRDEGRGR